MHEALRSHLKSIETGRPDEATFSSIAFRFSERIVDGSIGNNVIAIDVFRRDNVDFTASCDVDSRIHKTLHTSHTGSIGEQSIPQIVRAGAERWEGAPACTPY